MVRHTLRIVLAAAAILAAAAVAHAQPGLSTGPNYDAINSAERIDEYTRRALLALRKTATDALQVGDYAAAEQALADLVKRDPTTIDSHFLMGVAKMGLGKWDEARGFLEIAVQKEPKRPEPKARLGFTYAKLDNLDAARRQRAELGALDTACKGSCADARWIAEGIATLDQVIAAPATAFAGASPLPAPATPVASAANFDPAQYGLVAIGDAADLYDLLTREGRCAPKQLAAPREPCALILYRAAADTPGARSSNFKPVFRIDSRTAIWAIHQGKLQKVKVEDLLTDIADTVSQKAVAYRAAALVGNAENRASCSAGRPCLDRLSTQDLFRMYASMPENVVKMIWGGG